MIVDNLTVIVSTILIISAIITTLVANPFFRLRPRHNDMPCDDDNANDESTDNADDESTDNANSESTDNEDTVGPRLSVVVVSNGTAEQMDNHLSAILSQHYKPGFEVIVVAGHRDSETEDVLKRYQANAALYTTFVPQRSLFMSRGKLAMTIGAKAAHNEWVIITDSRYTPTSDHWLKAMATGCSDDKDLVLGYSNYAAEAKPFYRFERLREQAYYLRMAYKGTAFCANAGNVMFRRDLFINNDGYRGNLQFIQGEYDFIVNKYAQKGNAAVITCPDAWMQEDAPSKNAWRIEKIGFINYRGSLRGINRYRALHMFDTFCLHANYIADIAFGSWAAISQNWIMLAAACVAFIGTLVARTIIANKMFKRFNTQLSAWRAIPYELRGFWHSLFYRIRYAYADKHVFSSHKL